MTKDVAWLSAILIELFAANVKAPSPPADKVKSPAMSTAPEKSPVAASSSPLTVKLPELSNVNTALQVRYLQCQEQLQKYHLLYLMQENIVDHLLMKKEANQHLC